MSNVKKLIAGASPALLKTQEGSLADVVSALPNVEELVQRSFDGETEEDLPLFNKVDVLVELHKKVDGEQERQKELGIPERMGYFTIKSFNQTIYEAQSKPDPRPLFLNYWFEGDMAINFAKAGVGKSILATKIAESIVKEYDIPVFYVCMELSDKQVEKRYRREVDGQMRTHQFPEKLYRIVLDRETYIKDKNRPSISDGVLGSVEELMENAPNASVFILDNLTAMITDNTKQDIAAQFMDRLMSLKFKYAERMFSVLLIAHTPKIPDYKILTQDDLAGIKTYANLVDTVFAIGKSCKGPNIRYIKSVKGNRCEEQPGTVGEYELRKDEDGFLDFVYLGESNECDHLPAMGGSNEARDNHILELRKQGMSLKRISEEVGLGKTTVGDVIRRYEKNPEQTKENVEPEELPF